MAADDVVVLAVAEEHIVAGRAVDDVVSALPVDEVAGSLAGECKPLVGGCAGELYS